MLWELWGKRVSGTGVSKTGFSLTWKVSELIWSEKSRGILSMVTEK